MSVTTLISDTFTDAANTALTSHTMNTGSGWTNSVGTWKINGSNQAILNADGGDHQDVIVCDPGQADVVISCDVHLAATTADVGLVFNWQDANNYWLFSGGLSGTWHMYKRIAGTYTEITTSGGVGFATANTSYALKVYVKGDTVVLWVDGAFIWKSIIASRPLNTATKTGIRVFGSSDLGSTFDNFQVLSGFTGDLTLLTFQAASASSALTLINAFDGTFPLWTDNFGSNDIASYTATAISGATTNTISSNTLVMSGAGSGREILQPTGILGLAPYVYARCRVSALTSAANDTPEVGFYKDANNYVRAYMSNGQLGLDSKNNSVSVTGSPTGSYSAPYTIILAFNWPEVWAWIDTGSGPAAVQKITIDTTADLRLLTKFSASWLPYVGATRAAGDSVTFTTFSAGYCGAYNSRDWKPLTHANGQAYVTGGEAFWMGTCANGADYEANHPCIVAVNLTTYAVRLASLLMFNVASTDRANSAATPDTCTSLDGGQIIYDDAAAKWRILGNGWGYEAWPSELIHLWYAETTANILTGVNAIHAWRISPNGDATTFGQYDFGLYEDTGVWYIAGAEYPVSPGSAARYTAVYSTTDFVTFTSISRDNGGGTTVAEQQNWVRTGSTWYITSDNLHYFAAAGGPKLGDLAQANFTFSNGTTMTLAKSQSTMALTLIDVGGGYFQYITLKWDPATLYLSGTGTQGPMYVMLSDELQLGDNTWPTASSGVSGTFSNANGPGTITLTGVSETVNVVNGRGTVTATGSPGTFNADNGRGKFIVA